MTGDRFKVVRVERNPRGVQEASHGNFASRLEAVLNTLDDLEYRIHDIRVGSYDAIIVGVKD